jgi:hypothetical protein
MASKRMLKDWTTSEKMDKLSPEAEVFFVRLIMKADDFGNYTANIKLIRSALFPLKEYNDYQITEWLDECEAAGLLFGYEAEDRRFIHINNFDQKLRRMHATYPPPPDGQVTDNVRTSDGQSRTNDGLKRSRREEEDEVEEKHVPFDELFVKAFDELTCERLQMTFKNIPDLGRELQMFRTKCDNDPDDYHKRDVAGLRNAFQYQLKNYRPNGKTAKTLQDTNADIERIVAAKYGTQGTK